ncbi:MICOS complex subunit Mic10-like [Lucilia sericata]|uniref:MICOS complex subunit Mic10-like n=1 Tax=Lucilia sericata TaxID=13632 RepID=UPI0018A81799|nr:MICOS complex subunit Mic10-like [Lucilia sericata]
MNSSRLQPTFIEEEFASLLDRCCIDAFLKSSSGLVIGFLSSSLFLKQRKWPMLLGMGFGLGYAYASCEYNLQMLCAADVTESST